MPPDRTARTPPSVRSATPRAVPAIDRVRDVRYYPRDEVLEVEFVGGRTTRLAAVPSAVYRALRESPSPSGYYYEEVAGRYARADRDD